MKALVVVDYQVDFVNGALGFAGAEALDGIIVDKIRQTRRDNGAVIFTLDTHNSRYLKTAEGRKLPVPHCIAGTKGHALYGMVAHEAMAGDIVIKKPSFGSMALAKELKRGYYSEVELCGLVTDICVISNAIIAKAALPESRVVVDSRACLTADPEAQERALAVMRGVQIDVI